MYYYAFHPFSPIKVQKTYNRTGFQLFCSEKASTISGGLFTILRGSNFQPTFAFLNVIGRRGCDVSIDHAQEGATLATSHVTEAKLLCLVGKFSQIGMTHSLKRVPDNN